MRYRNISLNNDKGDKYYLIKYNENFKDKENQIKRFKDSLSDSVLEMPHILSELSEEQGYMLLDKSLELLGLVRIGTSSDERDLEVEVEFNEEALPTQEGVVDIFNTLISKLKLFFYDKNNIEIEIHNGINLSTVDPKRYKKMPYSKEYVTYKGVNDMQVLMKRLINEIKYASGDDQTLGQRQYLEIDFDDVDFSVDADLIAELSNGSVPLKEVFNKANSISWTDTINLAEKRSVKASRDGLMEVKKETRYIGSNVENAYDIYYNVLCDGFNLVGFKYSQNEYTDIKVENHNCYTRVQYDKTTFIKSKESGRTKIVYDGPRVKDTSVAFEVYEEDEQIKTLNLDIRTYKKSTSKVNGTYSLRVHPQTDTISLKKYSRKGSRSRDFSQILAIEDETLYEDIMAGNITGENVQKLVAATLNTINRKITKDNNNGQNRPLIPANSITVPNYDEEYSKVISLVQAIEEETPLPHLQEQLSAFVRLEQKEEKTSAPQLKKKF